MFRRSLSVAPEGFKAFPMSLEILFPVFYPGHSLVGLNHRAQEDCLQTRLLLLAYEEICKPVLERGKQWVSENIAPVSQQSTITRWFQSQPL